MIRILALLLVVALTWALWPAPQAAILQAYRSGPPEVVFLKTGDDLPSLDDKTLKALSIDFPQSSYFGAFAMGSDNRFGWVGNRHNIGNARIGALSRCGKDCEVIVELYPPGYARPVAGRHSVSAKVAAELEQAARPQAQPIFFALAANGSWAVQRVDETGPLARLHVLNRCRAYSRETQSKEACTLFHGPIQFTAQP